jgi:hypothetical protein
MYDFDPFILYKRLVPWFLRKPIFLSLLSVLSAPLAFVQGLLLAFVTQTTYDLLFNAQVIYLEHVLNDLFDSDPDIYIENVFLEPTYFYNDIEAQPAVYMRQDSEGADPFYMRNAEEYISAVQFIVHVDAALSGDVLLIEALIDTYNLSGMNYEIEFDL